jgi:hypothetical protein
MNVHGVSDPPNRWLRFGLVVLLAVLAVAASTDVAGPGVRVVALLSFLLAGPGLGLVGLLGIADRWREMALVIGVSLAVDLVVVSALAYGGSRTSGDALAVLIGIALVGAGAQLVVPVLRRRRGSGAA